MIGYIIGLVLGIIIYLLQNFKPTSGSFRILFLILSVAFMWGSYYADLGYWNLLVIPIGEMVLCFIAAFLFPYGLQSAISEYGMVNAHDYYNELKDNEKIGRINPTGFKQTYDRIIEGILTKIVRSQSDFQKLGNLLYSNNFYPISSYTKSEILQHIRHSIETTAASSRNGSEIRVKAEQNIEHLFNAFVSVMAIHEEATRNIETLSDK